MRKKIMGLVIICLLGIYATSALGISSASAGWLSDLLGGSTSSDDDGLLSGFVSEDENTSIQNTKKPVHTYKPVATRKPSDTHEAYYPFNTPKPKHTPKAKHTPKPKHTPKAAHTARPTSTQHIQTSDTIDEDGEYSDKDNVALYIHTYGKLPKNYITKKSAEKQGWVSTKGNLHDVLPGKSIGGDHFGNYDGQLPSKKGRTYTECDIDYTHGGRNGKRVIFSNDGLIFYTEDHYNTFEQLY